MGLIGKVLFAALSARFVVIENSVPSGHLYELPFVRMAECVVAVMQMKGQGATWMTEDMIAKHPLLKKFEYEEASVESRVNDAVAWAEARIADNVKVNTGAWAFVDAPDGSGWTMPCYYTTYADFYRYRSIAAVVLHSKEGVQLLPNPFSTRADDFRGTTLYDDFRRHSAVWAPELLAAEGVALCLTGSVNLKDLRAVVVALEKQNPGYKIVRFVDMHSYGGVMNV